MQTLIILGISGSLKSTSSNTRLLHYIKTLLPPQINYTIINNLDTLPHFNPDKEAGNEAIALFKQQIDKADAVIISTPEYAFGVPGTLKNALDWTVHTGNLNTKPVLALSCSPLYDGGKRSMASLMLTLNALGANINEDEFMCISDVYHKINTDNILIHQETNNQLIALVNKLLTKIRQ